MLAAAALAAETSEQDRARLRVCSVGAWSLVAQTWAESPQALVDELEKMMALRKASTSESPGAAGSEPAASSNADKT
jgi:hypothetical protein